MSEVVALTVEQILPLRVAVLRQGTPTQHCNYVEDELADVVHFGMLRNDEVVGTSTWFSKECPERPGIAAVQLKGMATAESMHGEGVGSQLISRGIELARERDARLVWARARDSALGFYEKCGFSVVGEGFIDGPTSMPHHIVILEI